MGPLSLVVSVVVLVVSSFSFSAITPRSFIGCTFARKDPNGFVKQAFSEDSGMAIGLRNMLHDALL